jgi:hypothetical protein
VSCIQRVVTGSVRPGKRSLPLVDPGVVYRDDAERGLGIIGREEGVPWRRKRPARRRESQLRWRRAASVCWMRFRSGSKKTERSSATTS